MLHMLVRDLPRVTIKVLFLSAFAFVSFAWHIVPSGKFHRIGGAPPKTFPSENYDTPEEVGGDRKCFDSPIRK